MYRLLIVDDETIVRTSLATMIDWNALGFSIAGSAPTGKAALQIAKTQPMDVVLTDIKMPGMDGLELMEQLRMLAEPPLVLVLSAYSDFDLVRKAFKLGALDYIVKNDVTPVQLTELIAGVKARLGAKNDAGVLSAPRAITPAQLLRGMLLGTDNLDSAFFRERYCLACFEIDDFRQESLRFGSDLETGLVQPLLEFAGQIPRVAAKCVMAALSPSRYVLYYSAADGVSPAQMISICTQVQKVWKNYMNLSATVGISAAGEGEEPFAELVQEAYRHATMKFIFGRSGIFGPDTDALFSVESALEAAERCTPLAAALKSESPAVLSEAQGAFFIGLRGGTVKEARASVLYAIYHIALMLADAGGGLWDVFNTGVETDFYQKISRLETVRDLEIWMTNFTRWVADYLQNSQALIRMDIIEKAKRFIADHYADPALSLYTIASYVGLNEKYFCTRFSKAVGVSFSSYLTDLRISMAKQMILKTDMKMYEVSEAAGFGSVEHFTRVFKKLTGTSPNALKKSEGTNI